MPDPLERIMVRILDAQLRQVKPTRNRALTKYSSRRERIMLADISFVSDRLPKAICGSAVCGTSIAG